MIPWMVCVTIITNVYHCMITAVCDKGSNKHSVETVWKVNRREIFVINSTPMNSIYLNSRVIYCEFSKDHNNTNIY